MMNSDFKEMLQCLNEADAQYLVIGAYAVMQYTDPRYTKDLDICIGTDSDNARRVFSALVKFGAPLTGISAADFAEPDVFFQIGVEPVRIDIITTVKGIDFEDAWNRRESRDIQGVRLELIALADLIKAKEASARPQDRRDLRALKTPARKVRKNQGPRGS